MNPIDVSDPVEIAAARRYARALARWRCGGKNGRSKLDPVYVDTTQGRDFEANWEDYSSCGDLLHAVAVDLGVPTSTPWINRDDKTIGKHWQFGTHENGHRDNISMLQFYGGPAIKTPIGYLPEPGDFLLCWHDNMTGVHVRIAGNTTAGVLESFDYGAGGMTRTAVPGAVCSFLKLSTNGGKLIVTSTRTGQSKCVQKIITLPTIMAFAGANRPGMTGEEIEELERRVP